MHNLTTIEIYDPVEGTWSMAGKMNRHEGGVGVAALPINCSNWSSKNSKISIDSLWKYFCTYIKIHIVLYMLTLLYFWWYESHDKTVATYNLVHIFQLYHSFTRNFNKNFISHRVKRSLRLCIVFRLIQTVNILGFPWLVTSSLKSNAFLFGAKMALSDWMRRTNEKWARVGDIL